MALFFLTKTKVVMHEVEPTYLLNPSIPTIGSFVQQLMGSHEIFSQLYAIISVVDLAMHVLPLAKQLVGTISKITKAPKIIFMHLFLLVKWNHRVLPWHVVKMKCFTIQELARDTW